MIITRGLGSNLLITRGYGTAREIFIKIIFLSTNDYIEQTITVRDSFDDRNNGC